MRPFLASIALVACLLAGCADGGDPGTQEAEPEAFEDVEVTATTGAIRGVVVNEAIVPLGGALVQITNGANQTTDEDGAFVFNGLEPGDYFLSASAPGYKPIQGTATVVAGEEPPITKFVLPADALQLPYTQLLQWDGFLACGFMWSSGTLAEMGEPFYYASYAGANACGVTDDRFIGHFGLDAGMPTFAQAEAVWEGTQPLSNDLTLGFWRGQSFDWKFVYGQSPLVLTANSTELNEEFDERNDSPDDGVADANVTDLPMRMFPGQSDAPASMVVTTNQAFTVYQTQFYRFEPREGWTFIEDGPCSGPEQCGA